MSSPIIFVLDDNVQIREAACHVLSFDYPMTIGIDSSATALDWIRKANPELVITDFCLPTGNGFQLLQQIRRDSPKTKLLLLSGYRDLAYLREGIRLGLSGYVVKQYFGMELNTAVRRILRGGVYFSPSLYRESDPAHHSDRSVRPSDVLRLVQKNFSLKEIAYVLNVPASEISRYLEGNTLIDPHSCEL